MEPIRWPISKPMTRSMTRKQSNEGDDETGDNQVPINQESQSQLTTVDISNAATQECNSNNTIHVSETTLPPNSLTSNTDTPREVDSVSNVQRSVSVLHLSSPQPSSGSLSGVNLVVDQGSRSVVNDTQPPVFSSEYSGRGSDHMIPHYTQTRTSHQGMAPHEYTGGDDRVHQSRIWLGPEPPSGERSTETG